MTHTAIAENKVSVVIPCYNAGSMPCEALASLKKVRNANLLRVVVDDGSSDVETKQILSGLKQTGDSVVSEPNCGLGTARY